MIGAFVIGALAGLLGARSVPAYGAAGFAQATGSPFAAPGATGSIALGDVNGDGNLDAVVAAPATGKLVIMLGNGRGAFAPPTSVDTGGTKPSAVALVDLNGDGKLDAVVANDGSNNVSVLLGNGAGGFTPAAKSPFATHSARPASVVVGDFNGDGKQDVAVASLSSADVAVMLGDGKGGLTLAGPPVETGGDHAGPAVVGDFNGDGKLDVAVANGSGNVSVLLGDGTGNLSLGGTSPYGLSPAAIAAGDFNSDGKLDVAVANKNGTVTILLGTGTGALKSVPGPAPAIKAGSGPASLVVADLDRDGRLDIAVANSAGGDLSVLLGDGAGRFAPAPGTPVSTGGSSPSALAVGDLNGDGKLDLAAVNAGSASVSVLLNAVVPPAAGFVSFPASPVVGEPVTFAYSSAGGIDTLGWDLNGDGVFNDALGPTAVRAFLAPGTYPVSLRVTDLDGLTSTTTRLIAVGVPSSPAVVTPITSRPLSPKLLEPFPVVRLTGRTASRGAHITGLEVRAPSGAKVSVHCKGKGCPFRKWSRMVRSKMLDIKPLKGRFLHAGALLEVRVSKAGEIGKYTRIVIRKRKPPGRNDLCLAPGSSSGSACPVT